jgi:putative endonuclease
MKPMTRAKRPALYHVYILRCRDGSLYTGIARDVAKRLTAHAAGKGSRCVAGRRPFRLVYTEPARSKSAALRREAAIKAMTRLRKLALVQSTETRRTRRRHGGNLDGTPP